MQRRFVVVVVALSLALLYSATANAMERPFQIGFGGGVSVPVSDYKTAFDNGFHGKAMFRWKVPALPLSLGTSLGYEKFDLRSALPGVTGSQSILSALGNASYHFPVGPIKPYVTAGLGAYNIKSSATGFPDASTTKFGIDGGLGIEFKLGGFSAFAEGKIENIYTEKGLTQSFNTQVIPVTFGILF
jgi:opacity protein-like surface antigen